MSTESILTNTDEYLRYKNGKNELVNQSNFKKEKNESQEASRGHV